MASTTGIEVSSDSCVVVSVRTGPAGSAEVRALHTIGAAQWRAREDSRADLLRSVRKAHRLPRRAVVVAWDLRDGGDDESARMALRYIEAAGFRIQSILTPPQALARVAERRRRPGSVEAIAWTALTTHGAAIAIVGRRELLFSRTFPWTYRPGLADTKSQLLQRYSLVAHLAPEVSRGIELVRASHGLSVEGVVTCGDLPELRSLTMPLIEELDLEVETLDSTEGLRAAGKVTPDRLRELAPAIRVACAAVLSPRGVHEAAAPAAPIVKDGPSAALRAAAAVGLIGALGWGAFLFRSIGVPVPVEPMPGPQQSDAARPTHPAALIEPRPVPTPSNELGTTHSAGSEASGLESQATDIGSISTPVSTALSVRAQPLLRDPLPAVESILMDQDRRRFALVEGAVVGVGDRVGSRTVIRIGPDALLLQEPSGRVVRASVRRKQGSQRRVDVRD